MTRKRPWMVTLMLALMLTLSPRKDVVWAATVTVNSTTDVSDGDVSSIANLIANPGADGVISLREAIEAANNTPGADTITFNIPDCGGVCSIQPLSALPSLSGGGTTIDGYTQPGAVETTDVMSATLLVEINGTNAGYSDGLHITSAGNAIKGLVLNGSMGGACGIAIKGSEATGNTVSGNYVGTDASGTADLPNNHGVCIGEGAQNNTIGGDTAAERNVISANYSMGVKISDSGTAGNIVSGNYIGTDASGTAALGNRQSGVGISNCAYDNTIGGNTAAERNVISGNGWGTSVLHGITIGDACTTGNIVSGNYIGSDASGTAALGNTECGVHIGAGQYNTVGGDTPGERNVISGNRWGVEIGSRNAMSNTVSGNYIGTDASGTVALGNGHGIQIICGAENNTIGGDTAGQRNVISGNSGQGVAIFSICSPYRSTGNAVSGNYIGTDASGTAALGNGTDGIWIGRDAQNNTVGGDTPGERNIISGNDQHGVKISQNATDNIVAGNYIGADASGTVALGNGRNGVSITYSWPGYAQNNTIGPGNVIAHNGWDGVEVSGSSTTGNIITQNSIYANGEMGIDLTDGANGDISTPDIATTIGMFNVLGTACPGCTVEIFENSDTDGEGESYVGNAIADAGGDFVVTVGTLNDPYLTATATEMASGTSEFSAVFVVSGRIRICLPLILKSH